MNTRQAGHKPSYQRPGLSEDEIDELKEAFNLFDTDGNGTIDSRELRRAMESLGYKDKNKMVYQLLDNVRSDTIDFEGFLDMMTAKVSETDSKDDILKIFKLFDSEGRGFIRVDDLERVARELGEQMSQEELKEMIERADLDGTGVITPDEFYNIMTRKTFG